MLEVDWQAPYLLEIHKHTLEYDGKPYALEIHYKASIQCKYFHIHWQCPYTLETHSKAPVYWESVDMVPVH